MSLLHLLICILNCAQLATTSPATTKASPDHIGSVLDALFEPPPGSIEVAPGISVVAQWGVWEQGAKRPGRPTKPGKELVLGDDRSYGITVFFFQTRDSQGGDLTYREVFTLPAKPGHWGSNGYQELPAKLRPKWEISADGRVYTFEQKFRLKPKQVIPTIESRNGIFVLSPYPLHSWTVAADDPPGDWVMEAFVNDAPVAKATFLVKSRNK